MQVIIYTAIMKEKLTEPVAKRIINQGKKNVCEALQSSKTDALLSAPHSLVKQSTAEKE